MLCAMVPHWHVSVPTHLAPCCSFSADSILQWPVWLSPRQVLVVPVSLDDALVGYAKDIARRLHTAGFYVVCRPHRFCMHASPKCGCSRRPTLSISLTSQSSYANFMRRLAH